MAYQLIYTSVRSGLVAGRSGFCTAARHKEIKESLVARIEDFANQYDRSALAGVSNELPVIYSHRIVKIRENVHHVLMRIGDAGNDYSGRTNHIAHAVVLEEAEVARLVINPAEAILHLGQLGVWKSRYDAPPRYFGPDEIIDFQGVQGFHDLPADHWLKKTGSAANAAHLVDADGPREVGLGIEGGSEAEALVVLPFFGESLLLLDHLRTDPSALWSVPFTTLLQSRSEQTQFRWYGCVEGSAVCGAVRKAGAEFVPLHSGLTPPRGFYANLAQGFVPPPPAAPPSPVGHSGKMVAPQTGGPQMTLPPPPASAPVETNPGIPNKIPPVQTQLPPPPETSDALEEVEKKGRVGREKLVKKLIVTGIIATILVIGISVALVLNHKTEGESQVKRELWSVINQPSPQWSDALDKLAKVEKKSDELEHLARIIKIGDRYHFIKQNPDWDQSLVEERDVLDTLKQELRRTENTWKRIKDNHQKFDNSDYVKKVEKEKEGANIAITNWIEKRLADLWSEAGQAVKDRKTDHRAIESDLAKKCNKLMDQAQTLLPPNWWISNERQFLEFKEDFLQCYVNVVQLQTSEDHERVTSQLEKFAGQASDSGKPVFDALLSFANSRGGPKKESMMVPSGIDRPGGTEAVTSEPKETKGPIETTIYIWQLTEKSFDLPEALKSSLSSFNFAFDEEKIVSESQSFEWSFKANNKLYTPKKRLQKQFEKKGDSIEYTASDPGAPKAFTFSFRLDDSSFIEVRGIPTRNDKRWKRLEKRDASELEQSLKDLDYLFAQPANALFSKRKSKVRISSHGRQLIMSVKNMDSNLPKDHSYELVIPDLGIYSLEEAVDFEVDLTKMVGATLASCRSEIKELEKIRATMQEFPRRFKDFGPNLFPSVDEAIIKSRQDQNEKPMRIKPLEFPFSYDVLKDYISNNLHSRLEDWCGKSETYNDSHGFVKDCLKSKTLEGWRELAELSVERKEGGDKDHEQRFIEFLEKWREIFDSEGLKAIEAYYKLENRTVGRDIEDLRKEIDRLETKKERIESSSLSNLTIYFTRLVKEGEPHPDRVECRILPIFKGLPEK